MVAYKYHPVGRTIRPGAIEIDRTFNALTAVKCVRLR
ncbi:Uncharacterised protein [Achromobacter xylosoxidans]|nr:Uncharacterised protein [Achromobacter xylosoxidans]